MIPFINIIEEKKEINLEDIQFFSVKDIDKANKIKEDILNGDNIPPITVIQYKRHMEIEDGRHRATAYHMLNRKIPAIVYSQKEEFKRGIENDFKAK